MSLAIEVLLAGGVLISAITGLCACLGIGNPDKTFRPGVLIFFFTNLSNLVAAVYFACYIPWRLAGGLPADASFICNPVLQMSVTAGVMLTFVIYHFVIAGGGKRFKESMEKMKLSLGVNLLMHYASPWLCFFFWLFFANKTGLSLQSALLWCVYPVLYFIVVFVCAKLRIHVLGKDREMWWPYPFMNLDVLGPKRFWINMGLILVALYAIGVLFVLIASVL